MDLIKELLSIESAKKPVEKKLAESNDRDIGELIDMWCDQNGVHSFEGHRGVENFSKLVRAMGYNSSYGDPLNQFLEDNSGAIEALIEWIKDGVPDEWVESLKDEVDDGEPEEM